ncbi:hypothetical protein HK104_000243 [Borealophlyctis nickersoniae]|nr:hypothetical protein HK104_000243 [Borealophlyctis nickersoniae]
MASKVPIQRSATSDSNLEAGIPRPSSISKASSKASSKAIARNARKSMTSQDGPIDVMGNLNNTVPQQTLPARVVPSKISRICCCFKNGLPLKIVLLAVSLLNVACVAIGIGVTSSEVSRRAINELASIFRATVRGQAVTIASQITARTEFATNTTLRNQPLRALALSSQYGNATGFKAAADLAWTDFYRSVLDGNPQITFIGFGTKMPSYIGMVREFDGTFTLRIQDVTTGGNMSSYDATTGNLNNSTAYSVDKRSLQTITVTRNALIMIIDASNKRLIATSGNRASAINITTSAQLLTSESPHPLAAAVGVYLDGISTNNSNYIRLPILVYEHVGRVHFKRGWLRSCGPGYATADFFFRGLNWLVIVATPEDDFLGMVKKMTLIFIVSTVGFSLLAAVIAIWSGLFLANPLHAMRKMMKRVQKMELSGTGSATSTLNAEKGVRKPPVMSSIAEIRGLQDGFDKMTKGLKSFEKFVPSKRIVQTILEDDKEAELSVTRREVTIFFSDIANFTNFSEIMQPKQLIFLLSEYLTEMSNIVAQHDGNVGEFIGDAIMAYWNSPNDVPNHPVLACRAALSQLNRLTTLRIKWADKGWPLVTVRIGLNTGSVLHGIIGSATRLKWGLVGDNVNLASRLESLCKHYGVNTLIAGSVRERVEGQGLIMRDVDVVAVKGRQQGTTLVELMGSDMDENAKEIAEKAKTFERIFRDAYLARRFAEAEERFGEFLVRYPGDGPATLLLSRLQRFKTEPPPADWDGTYVLSEK